MSASLIADHVALSPKVVGERLAQDIHNYVMQQQLGYYPALDFFQQQGLLDTKLLAVVEDISGVSRQIVCKEIQLKLRTVFSTMRFGVIQTLAFKMPAIRIHEKNAIALLAQHYTPNTLRCELEVSLLRHHEHNKGVEKLAKQILLRRLGTSFEMMQVCAVRRIS